MPRDADSVHYSSAFAHRTRPAMRLASHGRRMLSTMPQRPNPYAILGVAPGASDSELKAAYRKQALERHPDRALPADRAASEKKFKEITAAYQLLNSKSGLRAQQILHYADAFPSIFWEVLGVRKEPKEHTLDHLQRALMVRLYDKYRLERLGAHGTDFHTTDHMPPQQMYDDLYEEAYPSAFLDVLGVRRQHSEDTLGHVQRALRLRLFQGESEMAGSATAF